MIEKDSGEHSFLIVRCEILGLRTHWHTVDSQRLWRFLNSAHPSIGYPIFSRDHDPDVQHMLDPSSMSVSFFVLARTTMKAPAKCDKHCELQDSVNRV